MRIERQLSINGNLFPSVFDVLSNLPATVLHHTQHHLRHPLGIHNVAAYRVIMAFQTALNSLDAPTTESIERREFDPTPLLRSASDLLDGLQAYVDDCFSILRALTPQPTPPLGKVPRFTDQWL